MSESKIIRKRDGCLQDDNGTVQVGSNMNDTSMIVGDSNVTVTPGKGGNLQCASGGVADICGKTTDTWIAAVLPQVPSKVMTPQSFPLFSYILPITTIGVACLTLIKKEKKDG